LHLLIDSTGLTLFGKGEWDGEKHGRARRSWRKLHVAVDAETGEIVASVLTGNEAGDAGQVPVLLEQVEGEIASVTADGAYDGEPVYHAIEARQPQPPPAIVIPPRRSAVLSSHADTAPSQRDAHIRLIQEQGRSAWRKATGYGQRSLAETSIGRYKALVGPRLRARGLANQQGEIALGTKVLNRMIRVVKPISVRIAACRSTGQTPKTADQPPCTNAVQSQDIRAASVQYRPRRSHRTGASRALRAPLCSRPC
jgi:hypothetical protein